MDSNDTPGAAPEEETLQGNSILRIAVAAVLGLIGAVLIWVVTPYNNNYYGLSELSASYLPTGALFLLMILILGVNPLCRRFAPAMVLTRLQLLVVTAILLMASVHPSHGLMRYLPSMIAGGPYHASMRPELAEAYAKIDAPAALFPAEMKAYADVRVSRNYIEELPEGEPIPWRAWIPPTFMWGTLLFFGWLMILGLSMIVFDQWRNREHLPFPLVEALSAPLADPGEGRFLPPIFRTRGFIVGAGVVMVLYLTVGLNKYFPNQVPAFPLKWNLRPAFAGTILQHMHGSLQENRIFFVLFGIAFFMPTRISFSLWFFTVILSVHQVVSILYFPPHNWRAIGDCRTGAMIVMTCFIIWLGRARWKSAGRSLFRPANTEDDKRNRTAMRYFLVGMAGMFAWLVWMRVAPHWALLFVLLAVMAALVSARLVAETGIPYVRLEAATPGILLPFVPTALLSSAVVFFGSIMTTLFATCTRVSPVVIATHVFALDRKGGPRRQVQFSRAMLGVLVIGLLVCGAAHLTLCYRNSSGAQGGGAPAVRGADFIKGSLTTVLKFQQDEYHARTAYDQRPRMLFGGAVAGALYWACLNIPRWPLHPIGLLLADTTAVKQAFGSIFLGWLVKVLVLRYGGGRAERAARPLFIGVIIGEVLATILWALVSGVLAVLELTYEKVDLQPW